MAVPNPKKAPPAPIIAQKNGEILRLNRELQRYHLALDNVSDHIVITDPDGNVIYANKAIERITGFKLSEILHKKAGTLWGKQMSLEFYRSLWKTIKYDKQVFRGEIVNKRKNGKEYIVQATITPVLDERGEVLFYVGAEFDITEAKIAQRRLAEYAHRLEEGKARDDALLRSITDGIVVTNTTGKVIFVNEAFENLCGVDATALLNRDLDEAVPLYFEEGGRVPKEVRPLYIALDSAIQKHEPIFDTNTCYVRNRETGRKIPLSIRAAPFFLNRNVHGVVAVWRDIVDVIEVDKAKSEFISFASHQLRTPLTSVQLAIDILLDPRGETLSSEEEKYLKIARGSINEMADIIENLLNISRIQMGTLVVSPEPVHLAKFLDKILENASLVLEEKNMKVKRVYANNVPLINIDPQLLKIILENLISNAFKYGPSKSTITVEVHKKGEDAVVSVSDTGEGIPKNQQTKIFEKLFRVHEGAIKGTGLGLYMVKMAVDRYGGKVWCESPSTKAFKHAKEAGGSPGTTFFVTVPLKGMAAQKKATS